jgi:hypothetical protein
MGADNDRLRREAVGEVLLIEFSGNRQMKKFTCILLAAVMLSSVTFGQKYGPTTTLTVAAVDSSKQAIANSDFQCSGHSDDVIIQRAINRYATTGGKVELLAGTYRLSATVNLVAGVTVSGAGYATNIVAPSGAAAFTVNGTDNVTITDLRVSGMTSGVSAVDVDDSDNFAVRNVHFADVDTAAVNADTVNGLLVTGCYAPAGVNLVTTASCNGVVEAVNASRNVLASAAAGWSNCYIVSPNESLATAYDWLKSSDRDAVMGALSKTNRRTLLLLPGKYTLTSTLVLDASYVDVVGVGSAPEDVVVTSALKSTYTGGGLAGVYATNATVYQSADGVVLANFTIDNSNTEQPVALAVADLSVRGTATVETYLTGTTYTILLPEGTSASCGDEIKIDGLWYEMLGLLVTEEGFDRWWVSGTPSTGSQAYVIARRENTYRNMRFTGYAVTANSNLVNSSGVQGGTWINCVGDRRCFRMDAGGEDHSLMIGCRGGAFSFFGDYDGVSASGTYIDCISSDYSFGGCTNFGSNIDANALFIRCQSGIKSFALDKTCAGTFIDCIGGANCFAGYGGSGSYNGTFSGKAINCKASGASFGGGHASSRLSGTTIRRFTTAGFSCCRQAAACR